MTQPERSSIEWHLRLPVCETRTGCNQHLRCTPYASFCDLCRRLDCTADDILARFWSAVKRARGREAERAGRRPAVNRRDLTDRPRDCRGQTLLFS